MARERRANFGSNGITEQPMTSPCDYDDALPRFAALVVGNLGAEALNDNLFLRDASGRLTLVLRGGRGRYAAPRLSSLEQEAIRLLQPYVEPNTTLATPEELFDPVLVDPNVGRWERIGLAGEDRLVRLVDRRLVGQDWLTPPQPAVEHVPPVIVFASFKGGVGRSTAVAVAAAYFASLNYNVLTIDLDLEAPGIGGMLLPLDRTPRYGAVDYFVENGLNAQNDRFFDDMYGISPLTPKSGGFVHCVPAVGIRSLEHPQNFLGKLSRAYLEDPSPDGPKSFLVQTRELLHGLSTRKRYDVVLVDTRAGLHETTAAGVLGLGADVLLFGVDTPQTFLGYKFLLAHLTRFIESDVPPEDDWRRRLRLVHAKASADHRRWRGFNDRAFELFQAHLYENADVEGSDSFEAQDVFNFDLDDPEAPHVPWRILSDSNYAEFDPPTHPEQLEESLYARTFGTFLDALRERVLPNAYGSQAEDES